MNQSIVTCELWKDRLNSDADGKKFRQYPQDKQPSLTSSHWSMKKAADWQKSLQSKVVKIKNKDVLQYS
jgi:hypothetical protein